MSVDLLGQARSGDEQAFAELVEPYRHELYIQCYRILGSIQDAEDALQETLIAAWRGLVGFRGQASVRSWLYSVATNRSLNMIRAAKRRPRTVQMLPFETPQPFETAEALWLEPLPDSMLSDASVAPEARYETREAISLAFMTALQLLPARQRAVLVLRDVLGFHAAEVAAMLDTTEGAVTSALKRARATLDKAMPVEPPAPAPHSAEEGELIAKLANAFEQTDVEGIVALLTDDARLSMPPLPLEYRGAAQARGFLTIGLGRHTERRLLLTRANGQPALALYARDDDAPRLSPRGLLVVTLSGDRVSAITRFDPSTLGRFTLPAFLAAAGGHVPA